VCPVTGTLLVGVPFTGAESFDSWRRAGWRAIVSIFLKQPCDEGVVYTGTQVAPCPSRVRPLVLVATIVGSSMAFIDGTVVNVALPVLQTELKATVAGTQWVVESYSLFLGALILLGGALGDRLGRRRIYMVGITVFTGASLLCGVAPTLLFLVLARAMQGIGAAMLVPGSLALISATFPEEQRGRAIGTWSGFSAITSGLGPVLGGWLVANVSWRAIFFINLPLAAIVLFIASRWVPESRDEDAAGGLDWPGAALITLGIGGIVYGLVEASGSASTTVVLGAIVFGLVALAGFVAVELRSSSPMVPPAIFRSPSFVGANILTVFLYGALSGVLFFVPFNLIEVQGYSATQAGAAFLPFTVLMFLLSRWSGGLVDRFGAKAPLIAGPAIAALGLALFARPGIGGSYWTTFFPAIVALSLGMSIAVAPLTTVVMNAVDRHHGGVASGVNNACSRVSGLLAIAVFGIVAVHVFSRNLDDRLSSMKLSGPLRAAVQGQQDRLLAIRIPDRVPGQVHLAVHHAIAQSFVGTFRFMMLLGGALAIASVVTAAALIPGGRPGQVTRSSSAAPASEPVRSVRA